MQKYIHSFHQEQSEQTALSPYKHLIKRALADTLNQNYRGTSYYSF